MNDDDTQELRLRATGWLSIPAAASAALVSVHTVRAWIQKNEVEHTKVGNRRYVKRSSLAERLGPIAAEALGLLDS